MCPICRTLWKYSKTAATPTKTAGHPVCSPHPRGWSLERQRALRAGALLPAPAGMVPAAGPVTRTRTPAPRTRGDGPHKFTAVRCACNCSPHPRGWSLGDVLASVGVGLLPAPAGMVPTPPVRRSPEGTAPRTRGDGPVSVTVSSENSDCSPHPRGWSPSVPAAGVGVGLLPAPAGMVPGSSGRVAVPAAAPRTRGDGPYLSTDSDTRAVCSPHPRGWSRQARIRQAEAALLPAPAGMVPRSRRSRSSGAAAPRTRGDGPYISPGEM